MSATTSERGDTTEHLVSSTADETESVNAMPRGAAGATQGMQQGQLPGSSSTSMSSQGSKRGQGIGAGLVMGTLDGQLTSELSNTSGGVGSSSPGSTVTSGSRASAAAGRQ